MVHSGSWAAFGPFDDPLPLTRGAEACFLLPLPGGFEGFIQIEEGPERIALVPLPFVPLLSVRT